MGRGLKKSEKELLKKLGRDYNRTKKGRNFALFFSVLFASMFMACLLTAYAGVKEALFQYELHNFGTMAHGRLYGLTQEEFQRVKDYPEISEYSYSITAGVLREKDAEKSYYLEYAEDKKFQWEDKRFTGRLPEKIDEIVLSSDWLELHGYEKKLGEKVSLEWEMNGDVYTGEFSLCGYYESEQVSVPSGSSSDWHYEIGTYEIMYVSKAFVEEKCTQYSEESSWKEFENSKMGVGLLNVDYKYQHVIDLLKKDETFFRSVGLPIYPNPVYWQKDPMYINFVAVFIMLGILSLASIVAFWLINSMFRLSFTEDIHFFGTLQTLGMEKKQYAYFLRRQMLPFLITGTSIGGIFGMLLGNIFMVQVLKCFDGEVSFVYVRNPAILLASMIINVCIVRYCCNKVAKLTASYSPVEMVELEARTGNGKKKSRYDIGHFRSYKFAWRRVGFQKSVILSKAIPIVFFLLVFIFGCTVLKSVDKDSTVTNAIGNIELAVFPKNGLEISQKDFSSDLKGWKEKLNEPEKWKDLGVVEKELSAIEMEKEFPEMKKYILKYTEVKNRKNIKEYYLKIFGIPKEIIKYFEVTEGEYDPEKFAKGNYVLLLNNETSGVKGAEDVIVDNPAKAIYEIGDKICLGNKQYEIMAEINLPSNVRNGDGELEIPFILPEQEAQKLSEKYCVYGSVYCGGNLEAAEQDARAALQLDHKWSRDLQVVTVEVAKEFATDFTDLCIMISLFVCIFLGTLLLFYMVNTALYEIEASKEEMGLLASFGMSKRQLLEIWWYQVLYEKVFEIGIVVVVGSLLSYFVVRPIFQMTAIWGYQYCMVPVILMGILLGLLECYIIWRRINEIFRRNTITQLIVEE